MENPEQIKTIELADILKASGRDYIKENNLPFRALKVISNIQQCRSAYFGGHKEICEECGHWHISYNSCGDRNCPKCGILAKEKWLEARKKELLPVPYYHIVFTLPDLLNPLALNNPKRVFGILFKAAKETLIKLGKDPKHIGAEIGLIAILHTWGQNLSFHPHLHCIVPGGGLSGDGGKWHYPKKSKRNKKFFVHVNVISDLFKKIFLFYLKLEISRDVIKTVDGNTTINNLINSLYKIKWITYCKRPFGGPAQVLEYIGRYTHRTAISNNRILKLETCTEQGRSNNKVSFTWRDYRDANKTKIMTLEAHEFIRRFLMHVLPGGFFRIRYFGFLSSRFKKERLAQCRKVLNDKSKRTQNQNISWQERLLKLTGINYLICPQCGKGRMCFTEIIPPLRPALT